MDGDVLDFEEIGSAEIALVGGKGASLGELSRIEGVRVPAGFCVTTAAFQRALGDVPSIGDRIDRLSLLQADDREGIGVLSAEIRRSFDGITIPGDLAAAITRALVRHGERAAWAVRSSATAEDLPTASFAGQQDSFLNLVGPEAVLRNVRRCWASLFTERAVSYRLRNGFDHRQVQMAVVVQRMVFPRAAGVLFTADPLTGHRKTASVEATFGLGEALVSGRVKADAYKVREGEVVSREIAQEPPALTDAEAVRLVELGRRIEAHFGSPQDIEWCLVAAGSSEEGFHIVQSRPITGLFPIPEESDGENHVYVSVGHQQMMTDPLKPLGLSIWQLTTQRPMAEAGGRLFVDVTQALASPVSRPGLLAILGKSDPLIGDALENLLGRGDFIPPRPDDGPPWTPPGAGSDALETDPALVAELIEQSQAALAEVKRDIRPLSGPALLDFIRMDLAERRRAQLDPRSLQVVMAGMEAAWWLNGHLQDWLGEANVADTLSQSVPNNVTSEMGLALLDVADAIRPHPEVVAYLESVEDEGFLDELPRLAGGEAARAALEAWLDRYGMRGVGEIDITRPRFSERPTTLLPLILSHVKSFEAGEAGRRFERGLREAREKEREILDRLRALSDGARKAEETKRRIDRVRTFAGYREYPKFSMISRYFVYKEALMEEAGRLVQTGVLREREDLFYLRFEEIQEILRAGRVDSSLLRRRKEEFQLYQALQPPRVLTSDGESVAGSYRRDGLPLGALIGLPVSAGTVEGRARVVLNMAEADLEPGDILVTAFTDPSWTPLFVSIRGLVTEVGGLMTHGAVIAREYGLPALVGVENATRRIRDGQRIRVNGTEGYVEILS